ncbi:alpha/beta hydrolase domain-containing protein [Cryptosporangium japonicum]|uniref:Alpha/beta hydrolase domain-containing protein n=1 Tax=Cryptosporangium japonicum TaxID=80872 RepID=A0ABN0U748_9ACTN
MTVTALELLPGTGPAPDLAAAGYREEEYLVRGVADEWGYDASGVAERRRRDVPYTTRVLVRRPADDDRFTGVLQVEPLHPEYDTALTWQVLHGWIVRTGGAWAGVTQDHRLAGWLRTEVDPARYGALSIPAPNLRYELVADVAEALRAAAGAARVYLSGWSMTGSFARVFLGDGFHRRRRRPTGAPVFDGYVLGISSGGAGTSGYPGLSDEWEVPADDPRRTIADHDVPVVELLSELESETHQPHLRPDSDRYRLYQVAGTSHDSLGPRVAGAAPIPIVERPSGARLDLIGRAVFARLDDWVRDGVPPPRADRFPYGDDHRPARDADGNVLGGVRPPWIDEPLGRYDPHSTPAVTEVTPSPWTPVADPALMAWLRGHLVPLEPSVLARRYPSAEDYLARYDARCRVLVEEGLLLREDTETLLATATAQFLECPRALP